MINMIPSVGNFASHLKTKRRLARSAFHKEGEREAGTPCGKHFLTNRNQLAGPGLTQRCAQVDRKMGKIFNLPANQ